MERHASLLERALGDMVFMVNHVCTDHADLKQVHRHGRGPHPRRRLTRALYQRCGFRIDVWAMWIDPKTYFELEHE